MALLNRDSVYFDYDKKELVILDQTLLPGKDTYITLGDEHQVWDAIYHLKVRGAPAIGVAAAFGMYVCARSISEENYDGFSKKFSELKEYINSSRPTAVNLSWALCEMERIVKENVGLTKSCLLPLLLCGAQRICDENSDMCRSIGDFGAPLIKNGYGILTHCNAGHLATVKYGTALAPVYRAAEQGVQLRVFADETRPLLQGARLTAFELMSAGVDTTLICDNMASTVMKNGWVDIVFVGADRIAANGDTANKIGTSGVAILAEYYHIPFYVCAPLSTFDISCASGDDIPVEMRNPCEVTSMWYEKPMAPRDVKVFNPSFDVTPCSLITGIITEYGIAYPPFADSIKELFKKKR